VARRTVALAITLATILAALSVAPAAASDPPLPSSMAAVGDSITQAASTVAPGVDTPQNSWATGTNPNVNSHYLRLLALNPAIGGRAFNHSVSGAKMFDLAGQMAAAGAGQPEYLTVLIGGNDICTSTEETMTGVDVFRDQFVAAMETLRAASPNTQVYVVSIPRVMGLYELFKDDGWARFIWSIGNVCQSLLARPTSTEQADIDRRLRVAQRNVDFNTVLAEVCAIYQPCRTDGGAVYATDFIASDVSSLDYFHPSTAGQRKLAAVSWSAGYWPNAVPQPVVQQMRVQLTATTARKGSNWTATVIVSVRRPDGTAVSGALVSATWTVGASDTCTTTTAGTCSVVSDPLRRTSVPSVTMTVENVTHATLTWDRAGSQQQITVNRPT